MGRGYGGGGKREIIYLSLHCHHQNDSFIKVGSDESHFNVSLIVTDKVTRERRAEAVSNRGPSAYQAQNALPLGQSGSLCQVQVQFCLTSTETKRTIRDGEPRTSTSTFTQLLSSDARLSK